MVNKQLTDRMHHILMKSQTSITVVSAVAKLIVIRREDKTFLNEMLKQSIDRVILEQDFKDFDRPLNNNKDLQLKVEKRRHWTQRKMKLEEETLREAHMMRNSIKF